MSNVNNMKKGFTLIELLVSILIIVVLTGSILVIVNPSQIRGRARDSQRVADLKIIQTALEQYYLRNRAYPSSVDTLVWGSTAFVHVNGTTDRLSDALLDSLVTDVVPTDPSADGSTDADPCEELTHLRYNYIAPARNATEPLKADAYILTAIMESDASNDDHECNLLDNWDNGGTYCTTFATRPFCYGVESR